MKIRLNNLVFLSHNDNNVNVTASSWRENIVLIWNRTFWRTKNPCFLAIATLVIRHWTDIPSVNIVPSIFGCSRLWIKLPESCQKFRNIVCSLSFMPHSHRVKRMRKWKWQSLKFYFLFGLSLGDLSSWLKRSELGWFFFAGKSLNIFSEIGLRQKISWSILRWKIHSKTNRINQKVTN